MTAIEQHSVERPEGRRHFLKFRGGAAGGKRPLVILLHGSGASARQLLGMAFPPSPFSVWLDIARREGLIILAPDGDKRRGVRAWNDGYTRIASNPRSDDVGLVAALIDKAVAEDGADPERVFVMGVSKGGMLAYRVAAEIGHRLAGFAAVLASMPVDAAYAPAAVPVSALVVGGTKDPFIPYQGGKRAYTLWFTAPALGIEASAAVWRELAGLPPHASVTNLTPPGIPRPTQATRYVWGADPAGLQVALLRIDGGGHAEPSASKRYPKIFDFGPGRQNGDIEVAEEAWEFFKPKRRVALDEVPASNSLRVDALNF